MSEDKLSGGHTSTVLCVDVQQQSGQVISGSEGGELCLWSPNGQLVKKVNRPNCDCTSVVFSKETPHIFYASFGQEILIFDSNSLPEPIFTFQSNVDEVNQIVLDAKEQFLASCDDAGDIKVFGLQDRKVFKTLRFKHTNICSTVVFRSGRPWEVLSGGLDCRLVHWDFSKPKCLNQFNMQELYATLGDPLYMINPPFVHHVSDSPNGLTYACALENGRIPVLDASHKNLQPRYALFGHSQGVSQVQFINDSLLISSGNDACLALWDLTKAEQYNPENIQMNGDCTEKGSPEEEKNMAITELCRVRSIQRSSKVNWIKPFGPEHDKRIYIADQSSDLSILNLSL